MGTFNHNDLFLYHRCVGGGHISGICHFESLLIFTVKGLYKTIKAIGPRKWAEISVHSDQSWFV